MSVTWTTQIEYRLGSLPTIAISSTGQYIYTIGLTGSRLVSHDYGATFVAKGGAGNQPCTISCNSTGQYVISCQGFGGSPPADGTGTYRSSDYGMTWTYFGGFDGRSRSVLSSSGQYIALPNTTSGIGPNGLFMSSDYGQTWTQTASSSEGIFNLVIDSTGQYVKYFVDGAFFSSSNYGVTFTSIGEPFTNIRGFVSDSTGQKLAIITSGPLYTSLNGGTTWITGLAKEYISISSSSTGQSLLITTQNPMKVYISSDYGATLVDQAFAPTLFGVATSFGFTLYDTSISGDGTKFYIADSATGFLFYGVLVGLGGVSQSLTLDPTTITPTHKPGIGATPGGGSTPPPGTSNPPPHGGNAPIVVNWTPGVGTNPGKIAVTNPSGTVTYSTGDVPATILNPGGNNSMKIGLDGSTLVISFNGKVIITYLLTPQLFPNLFTGDGWIGWVDGTGTVIDGATPVSIIAPLTGYKYNFIGRIFDSPIGYDSLMFLRGKQWRGVSVLFRTDGTNYSSEEVENNDILNAQKFYWGGRDYKMGIIEASVLNNAGYGSYLTDIS